MIYWKVDLYGYNGIISEISMDKLTLVDKNRFYTVQTSLDDTIKNRLSNKQQQLDFLTSKFGDNGIGTIYNVPSCQYNLSIINDSLKFWFPSYSLSFVNAFSNFRNFDYYVIYFITLGKVLILKDSSVESNSYNAVGTVSGKSITIDSFYKGGFSLLSNQLYYYTNSACYMLIPTIYGYEDGIDLGDPTIWRICRGYFENNTKDVGIELYINWNHSGPLANIIRALFPTGKEKPDGTIIPPDNPYEPGGSSGEGGGGGSFDKDSDLIPDSSLPSISAANTGFTRIYNPTLAQVQDLARYLWTGESVIETIWNHIKQYFESPMEAILGFNLVPVPVPNGGVEDFALMYIKTGVMMNTAANQFVDRDCGTFELKPYYGSALDYSPHTKVSCFLPYIGTVQLNTDEVMGTTLQVKYRVDICSGSCVAKIFVNGSCLYQYSGHCAINIPISASDFSSYVSSAISVAKLAIGAATGAGMAAAASVLSDPVQQTNQVVTRTTTTTETARNPLSGRQITTGTRSIVETTERPADVSSTQASFDGLTPSNISNTVGQIMGSKPHVEHSGSFSGNTGYLGVRRPFLIIERPNMCMPEQYQQFNGFPAMITMPLSECTGFTQVQQVQLTGMEATNPEQSEILQMLKTGVIL